MTVNVGGFMAEETFQTKVMEDAIETAAKSAGVDATAEEWGIVADLNTALTAAGKDLLPTTKRLCLSGMMEVIQSAAAAEYAKWRHGDVADGADTERTYTTAAAAASYFIEVPFLFTDETGNIGIKIETVANITLKFHLEMYREIQTPEE